MLFTENEGQCVNLFWHVYVKLLSLSVNTSSFPITQTSIIIIIIIVIIMEEMLQYWQKSWDSYAYTCTEHANATFVSTHVLYMPMSCHMCCTCRCHVTCVSIFAVHQCMSYSMSQWTWHLWQSLRTLFRLFIILHTLMMTIVKWLKRLCVL